MRTDAPKPDPGAKGTNILHEADIGSGERTPGQQETDEMIKSIPPRTSDGRPDDQDAQAGQPAKG